MDFGACFTPHFAILKLIVEEVGKITVKISKSQKGGPNAFAAPKPTSFERDFSQPKLSSIPARNADSGREGW
jgi:hypothetical protein